MMISQIRQRLTKLALLTIFLTSLVACSSAEMRFIEKAQSEASRGHFRIALSLLDKAIARKPELKEALLASREAARISYYEIKDYSRAVDYYKHIVLYSPDSAERLFAQKQIATVYFDHVADYEKAITELHKLVNMSLEPEEKHKYKMNLARAYYYLNNFDQAEHEVDEFLRDAKMEEDIFEMLMLKGNINLAKKELESASKVYLRIIKDYPERSQAENVGLTLALCYEEMRDYGKAIQTLAKLKEYHPVPEYIDLRIKRLEVRKKNQPGARGFRK